MPNILIVEDSPTQAARLEHYLTTHGYTATIASDAETALEFLDRQPFDLVISDIVMPGLSGYDLCKRVKESEAWKNIPVILLTTLKDPMDIIQGLESGADNFFTKPYEPANLVKRVEAMLDNRRLVASGKLRVGFEVSFLGRRFGITSDRQQILDLLISTFEQIIETNHELERRKEELAVARARVESYARQLEERVEVSEGRYQALLENAGHVIITIDDRARILTFNRAAEALFQLSSEEALGTSLDSIAFLSEGLPISAATARYFEGASGLYVGRGAREITCRRKDNSRFPFEAVVTDVTFGRDKMLCISGRDITERKEAQEALSARERQVRLLLDSTGEGIYAIDKSGLCTLCNPAAARMLGYASPSDLIGRSDLFTLIHCEPGKAAPDMAKDWLITRAMNEGQPLELDQERLYRADGTSLPVYFRAYPIRRDDAIIGAAGTFANISRRKQLEDELRQSQKMEAIGKLTGGVGHDFNNLLTVIVGNLQLLETSLVPGSPAEEWARSALGAAMRGADLTRRLLAFARRQVLDPVVCNVNELVGGLEDLLRRTLGEDITLDFRLAPNTLPTKIDPGQLEHAILNLAVNARDAMEEGGRLTIETANEMLDELYAERYAEVKAGPHVLVAVSDTGSGMTPEVIEKAFEPFFTTKPVGKGTGLGLSMVYGFIKQSGGHVAIYSEVGRGTSIKLYLPADQKNAATGGVPGASAVPDELSSNGETVLLVEDEPSVQRVGKAILTQLGYTVICADHGTAALEILEQGTKVDLLFTDIMMRGGMNGTELARTAREKFPAMKVLFCSGYAENAFIKGESFKACMAFISKPYDRTKLAKVLRKILSNNEGPINE